MGWIKGNLGKKTYFGRWHYGLDSSLLMTDTDDGIVREEGRFGDLEPAVLRLMWRKG